MRDLNEHNITDAVLESFAAAPNPRLLTIVNSLVRHLHSFVKDIEPTFDEWIYAIQFLTRTGQISDASRQEFILLSDVLGVSMLVDAINHRTPEGATQTTVLGPFFIEDAPQLEQGEDISNGVPGVPLYVDVTVTAASGEALPDAVVDVWQSDSDGFYDVQRADVNGHNLRGRFRTGPKGELRFWSITPTAYPIPNDGPVGDLLKASQRHPWRPAHLHFMISAEGYQPLVTHIFVDGDIYLDSDAVFGVKQSLIDPFPEQPAGAGPDGRILASPWRQLNYSFGLMLS
jgi:hydroxyquinol 1,2-dioxygenase